MLASFPKVPKT